MKLTTIGFVAAAVVIAGALAGCGTTKQASLSDDAYVPRASVESLSEYRSVYGLLSQHPLASEMTEELGRVEEWLGAAEQLAGAKEHDASLVRLYVEAIGGELVVVKTWYDLRASEARAGRSTSATIL